MGVDMFIFSTFQSQTIGLTLHMLIQSIINLPPKVLLQRKNAMTLIVKVALSLRKQFCLRKQSQKKYQLTLLIFLPPFRALTSATIEGKDSFSMLVHGCLLVRGALVLGTLAGFAAWDWLAFLLLTASAIGLPCCTVSDELEGRSSANGPVRTGEEGVPSSSDEMASPPGSWVS